MTTAGLPAYEISKPCVSRWQESAINLTYWHTRIMSASAPARTAGLASGDRRHKKPEDFLSAVESQTGNGLKVSTGAVTGDTGEEAADDGAARLARLDLCKRWQTKPPGGFAYLVDQQAVDQPDRNWACSTRPTGG